MKDWANFGGPGKMFTKHSDAMSASLMANLGFPAGVVSGGLGAYLLSKSMESSAKGELKLTPIQARKLETVLKSRHIPRVLLSEQDLKKLPALVGKSFPSAAYASINSPEEHNELSSVFGLPKATKAEIKRRIQHGLVIGRKELVSPSVLAHELSHGTGDKPGALGRFLYAMGMPLGLAASFGAGALTANPTQGAGKYLLMSALKGGGAGLLFGAPQLYEEARASLRATQALREAGVPEERLDRMKSTLRRAYGTYLLSNVLPAAGAAVSGAGLAYR
jgi:hypothetical protein